jgi:2-dehydro-3-deoxyphosphooctonate aldolase (KDO 8-P synthase)
MQSKIVNTISLCDFNISNKNLFVFIGGPCAIETESHAKMICQTAKEICNDLGLKYIFKSSFDKANRTSIQGKRGIGIHEGLKILHAIRSEYNVPVLTDIHLPDQCADVAKVTDILQIPAFLCRQTDLLEAAAKTGRIINVKKGQFVSPDDMANIVEKLKHFGAKDIMLTDRGTCFGYHSLISDFKGLPIMAKTGCPIIFDATHSIQTPSSKGECSGGNREFAPILARAAVAVGVAGIFMEIHDDPDNAPCDGPNMIHIKDLKQILIELVELDKISKRYQRDI